VRLTGFSPLVRSLIYERSAGRCEICDEWASDAQLHHRRARGMGSTRRPDTNLPSNALLLCAACHRRKIRSPASESPRHSAEIP